MNPVQRLFSNALLSFAASLIARGSDALLFIALGRLLGPAEAGNFTLGKTYFTIAFTLSAWGLHELLVREVARHRSESGFYFFNYLVIRLLLAVAAYGLLVASLNWLLPYNQETKSVIRVISLAILPEAALSLCQALFLAHERMRIPTLAALANGGIKLAGGLLLLDQGADVRSVAWMIPIGATISLLAFVPFIFQLIHSYSQSVPLRLSWKFSLEQIRFTPGFVAIGLFYMLDFQTDTFLISLYLGQAEVGWYGAAQTIMLGFWMLAIGIRNALYPVMTRFQQHNETKYHELYRRAMKYLLILILPVAAGITLLAEPIIVLIFDRSFLPATAALQWSIWATLFVFLNVPTTILMLVFNRQRISAWIGGISMTLNITLNLLLLPVWGIVGAAMARVVATLVLFLLTYRYVDDRFTQIDLINLGGRPLLAVGVMSAVVWLLRELPLFWPILGGVTVYSAAIILLGAFSAEDRRHFRMIGER